MTLGLSVLFALALDRLLGEPRRGHPLVGFGTFAAALEAAGYGPPQAPRWPRRLRGLAAWALAVLPWVVLAGWLAPPQWGPFHDGGRVSFVAVLLGVLALYLALGGRALAEHARPVAAALAAGELARARQAVARIVSRDTAPMDAAAVSTATVESVLENGCDAVFGALFWFALAGAPGVVLYRLANTLDAMWGYRNARYADFGWAAARLDDLLNLVPARLTALAYALAGRRAQALRCWRTQGRRWKSPNAGPVMAAGAGALGVRIGGPARYGGEWQARPVLGEGPQARPADIGRALRLVDRATALWLLALVLGSWFGA